MKHPARIMAFAACAALLIGAAWAIVGVINPRSSGPHEQQDSSTVRSPVDEVLANIRAQPVGDHTVADYDLPEEFLKRVADRIIRESYEEQFRVVVAGAGEEQQAPDRREEASPKALSPGGATLPCEVRVIDWRESTQVAALRAELIEGYPPMPGFRANLMTEAEKPWPYSPPRKDASPEIQHAAEIVGRRLASDGLIWTLAQAVETIGPKAITNEFNDVALLEMLRTVGLPVDLIDQFHMPDHEGAASLARWMAHEYSEGKRAADLRSTIERIPFKFAQSWPGFQVATESGEHELTGARVQLTRGGYWDGVGDGGNVDLLRQIIEALPMVRVTAVVERRNLDEFISTTRTWPSRRELPLELIPVDRPLAQWAHDNGKPGMMHSQPTTIVPRYASRGEIGAIFVPGETFVIEGVVHADHQVVQSPLLFQGGNLLAVRHPVRGERLLLIGEAEIHRNRVLGLTQEQILAAFRVEFGVDQCIVLPSVSFHIDMDLCVREHEGRLIAFVNDTPAAAAIVLESAIGVLRTRGHLDDQQAAASVEKLKAREWREALTIVGPLIHAHSDGHGRFPVDFAELFSTGPVDSGVGNLHRVLQAMDTLAALTLTAEESSRQSADRVYLEAIARREAGRIALHQRLGELGFDVVPIPSLADGTRGVNAINGIHARGMYLMPEYGGLLEGLDKAANDGFARVFGENIRIVPILTGESQRRSGAVHCSISPIFGQSAR